MPNLIRLTTLEPVESAAALVGLPGGSSYFSPGSQEVEGRGVARTRQCKQA